MTGNHKKSLVSAQELKALSQIAVEKGVLDFSEHEMIMNILRFDDVSVKEAMTPRRRLIVVSDKVELDQVSYFMAREGHSRYPVYRGQEDNIIGFVHLIDVIRALNSNRREEKISSFIKPILRFNSGDKITGAFKKMLAHKTHIALVYDKQKRLVGVITLEDILEELVGEIEDEHDEDDGVVIKK